MSKRKPKRDFFAEQEEWNQHAYNPYYWVNRISPMQIAIWRATRKFHRLVGGLGMLVGGTIAILYMSRSISEIKKAGGGFFARLLDFRDFGTGSPLHFVFTSVMLLFLIGLSLAIFLQKDQDSTGD